MRRSISRCSRSTTSTSGSVSSSTLWLLARLSRGLTPYRRTALSAVALYWYFVSIAGLFVTATILSSSW